MVLGDRPETVAVVSAVRLLDTVPEKSEAVESCMEYSVPSELPAVAQLRPAWAEVTPDAAGPAGTAAKVTVATVTSKRVATRPKACTRR